MSMQENPYPLRIDKNLAEKLKKLAKENKRSYNKQLEFILSEYISDYEKKHGVIEISK